MSTIFNSISHQHYQQLTGIYIPQNAQTCILYTFFIKENWNILTTKWSEKMLSVNLHIIRGTCPLDGIITSINHLVIFYKSNHFKSITTTTPFVCCLFYTIHALGLIHLWNKCPLLIFLLMQLYTSISLLLRSKIGRGQSAQGNWWFQKVQEHLKAKE